jgi:hypothetical protein
MGYVGSAGSGYSGSVGGFNSLQTINVQTGTNYTVVSTDAGAVVELYNLAPINVTIPPDSSLTFGIGQRIDIVQASLGSVFFTGGLGVVVNVAGGVNYLNQIWTGATLLKTNINEWLLVTPSPTGFTGSTGIGFQGSAGAGYAGSIGGFSSVQPISIQTGTSYVIQTADAGAFLEFFNTSTITVNIPPDSALPFSIGQRIDIIQRGAGAVFFNGGPGVLLITPDVNYLNIPNVAATLIKTAYNEWTLITPSTVGYTGSTGAGFIGSAGTLGYAGSVGGFASVQPIVAVTGTSYTFQSADAGDLVQFFNTATSTVTIAPDSTTFFPVGTRIDVVQRSTGAVFFVGGAGVTVNTPDVNYINVTNVSGTLIKTAANEWLFTGPAPSGYAGSSGAGFVGSVGTAGYVGSTGGFASAQQIVLVTATSYTFQLADAGDLVQFNNTATTTVTIAPDSTTFFPIGTRIDLVQRNLGAVFFVGGVGVTVNTPDVNYINVPNISATIIKTGVNEWLFTGPSPSGYVGSSGSGYSGSAGTSGYIGSTGGFNSIQPISVQTGTSYVIQTSDAGTILEFFSNVANTVTIPADSALYFSVGQRIDIIQRGLGAVFFTGSPGVNLITPDVNYLNVQNVGASLVKTAANEWTLITPAPSGYTGSSGSGFIGSTGQLGFVGSTGGFASAQTIVAVTGTSYTFQLTDAGDLVQFYNSATTTVTVPNDSATYFPIGTRIEMVQRSTGPVFFVGQSGVTVVTPDVNYISVPNISATIIKTGVNEWLFTGPAPSGYAGSSGSGYVGSAGQFGYSGSLGGFASAQTILAITGTTYTFQLTDAGDLVQFFNTATTTVTVPNDNDAYFPVGTRIEMVQRNTGPVFFVGGSGVNLITPDVNYINIPNISATIIKTASNEWLFTGPSPSGYSGSSGAGYSGSAGTFGYSGSVGSFASAQPIASVTATSYTFQLADAGNLLQFYNTATTTVTIPNDSATYFPIGTRIEMVQRGTAPVFFVGGVSVTLVTPDVNYINVPNISATVIKTGVNEWLFTGPAPNGYVGSAGAGYSGSAGLTGYVGSLGGFGSIQVINIQTGTNYSIQSSDAGSILEFFNTATTTVTIPPDSSLSFYVGQRIDVIQRGLGQVFFAGGVGVTVITPDVNYLSVPNTGASLVKTAANEWTLITPAQSGFTGSTGAGYSGSQGTSGYAGSVGGFASAQLINIQTGTSYSIQSVDAGVLLEFFNTATTTVTIPNDSLLPFSIGQRIDILQRSIGAVFFVGGSGVTVNSPDVNYINAINVGASLVKTGVNEWFLTTPSTTGFTGSTGSGFTGSSGAGYAGSAGGFNSSQFVNIQTGTAYTVQLGDAGSILEFFNSATTTVTVPSDAVYQFQIGQRIDVVQRGSGSVFIVAGSGANLYYQDINFLAGINSAGTLTKTGNSEWLWTGPGAAGYTGSFGYTGSVGFIGSQGPKGDPGGYTGSAGTYGYTGSLGFGYTGSASTATGYVGSVGALGYTGSSAGYTGSSGAFAALGYAGSAGSFASAQPIISVTATSYTFQLTDAGDLVQFNNTATITVTVAPDSSILFPVGTRIDLVQRGTGAVFFVGGAGVLVNAPDTNYINLVNDAASIIKTGANEWLFTGPSRQTGFTGSGAGFTGSGGQGFVGSTGGFNSAQVVSIQTSTAYTIQTADAGAILEFFNTSTNTVTIPPDSVLSFGIGQRIDIVQRGLGAVFFTGGVGVTLITPDVNYINTINVGASLIKTGANEWTLITPAPSGYTGSIGTSGFIGSQGFIGYSGSVGSFASIQFINVQTGTNYSIQTNDAGSILEFFNSGTNTVTIPPDNSLPFSVGQRIDIIQRGAGAVFFTGGAGVTLITPDVNYLNIPNTGASLIKTANNEWTLITPATNGYTGSSGAGFIGSAGVGYAGSLGGFASAQTIIAITATSYTFQLSDAGDLVQFFNTGTSLVTIPNDSVTFFPTGTRIDVVQRNAGSVFFVGANGVTFNTPDINYISQTNIGATIVKTGPNEWLFTGPAPTGYVGSVGTSGFVGSVGTVGFAGSVGGFASAQVIVAVTATAYSFQLSDAGDLVQFFNTATTTVTVPNDSLTFFPTGTRIDVVQRNTGAVFFVGGSGVTVNTSDVNYINTINVSGSLIKTGANEWLFTGPSPAGYTGSSASGFVGSAGLGYIGSAGGFTSIQTISIQTGTSYTIQTNDAGSILEFFNSSTNVVTIPNDSALFFSIGQRIDVLQRGLGSVFFVGGSGVAVNTADVNYLSSPNSGASLIKTGANEWSLITPSPAGYTGSVGPSGFVGSLGVSGYIGSTGGFNSIQPISIQTGTSYIIQTADAGSILEFFNTATTTVTIPPDSALPFLVGQRIDIIQRGVGTLFFAGGPSVALIAPDVNYINVPNTSASLVKTAANEWTLITSSPNGYTGSVGLGFIGSAGTVGYSGSTGGFASAQIIVAVTGTSYTFQLSDAGDLVQFFNTATTTVTIPNDSAIFYPIGTRIEMVQRGTGQVFFVGASGVTVNTPDVNYINVPNISATIIKTGVNEWLFTGPSPSGYTGSIGAGFVGSAGSSGYSGSVGSFASIQFINIQTGTNYTIQSSDAGSILEFFNTGTNTVTIPPESQLPFAIGQRIDVIQRSVGPVFFTGGVGVTLITPDVNYINVPNAGASLVKTASNEWTLITPSPTGYVGSSGIGFVGSIGSSGYIGSVGGFNSIQPVNIQTGTSYTLSYTDAGSILEFFNSATTTVTIPPDNVSPFTVGQRIDILQRNTGAVFFVGGVGVTINSPDVNFVNSINAGASLIKTAVNEWALITPASMGYTGSSSAGYVGSVGAGYVGSTGGFASAQTLVAITATSYTFRLTDAGDLVQFYSSATTTVTVPGDSVTNFPVGTRIDVSQRGSGTVFFVGGSGVTLNYSDVNFLSAINSAGTLVKTNANEWLWTGPGPAGYTGSIGPQGPTGAQGPAGGYTGSQGAGYGGSQGDVGPLGYVGSQGAGFTGSFGYVGSVGYIGSIGIQGYTGSYGYTGFQGSQGDRGYSGSSGYTGSQSYTGSFGYSGSQGYTGSQGIGYTGSQSYTGSQGYTGSFGYAGSQGIGYTGSQGLIGYVGSTGLQGPQGPAGGFTGSQGVLGFAGSVGQGTAGVTRTYFYEGTLKENYSNKRFYIAVASTLYITRVNLNTAGGTQTTININVNGATINTVVIPAGVTYIQNTGTYSLYANDYITVDITQASSANNLYVTFVYREVL